MRQTAAYFLAQLKRVRRLLPWQIPVNLAVCLCVGVLASLLVAQGAFEAEGTRYRIGVVGDMSESYLGFGIAVLKRLDGSRLMIELVEMSEQEAEEALMQGDIYAAMHIPDGLMDSIVYGKNDKRITYTPSQGQQGLGTMVMGEITDIASTLVTSSQSAIYAMQRVLANDGRGDEIGRETDKLNLSLINLVLSREDFGEVEALGYADGLSMELYYFCGMTLLLLLLMGLLNSAFFLRRSVSLPAFLKGRGVGALWQTLGEYMAYLALSLAGLFCLCLFLAFGLGLDLIAVPEWEEMSVSLFAGFVGTLLPVTALFAALQFFCFEAADGIVNGILLQMICGIGMGYLSGYFYPSAFFPERMRLLGELLPTGAASRFVEAGLLGEEGLWPCAAVLCWTAVFLALAAAVRRVRIEKS